MKTTVVLCPTVKRATWEWENAQRLNPDLWVEKTKYPLSLTSKSGTKYLFKGETEGRRGLIGLHGDLIFADDFILHCPESQVRTEFTLSDPHIDGTTIDAYLYWKEKEKEEL